MRAADVIVVNGAGFEPWIDGAVANLDGQPKLVIEASRAFSTNGASAPAGATTLPADGLDPHFWLDPLKASGQAVAVLEALTAVAPAHREVYEKNAERLIEELELLHDQYSSALEGCRLDIFVTSHAAFGHLATRYGIVQIPLTGLSPEAEPATAKLARLTDQIEDAGVKYVLAETFGSRRLSQTVADEVGATLLDMHPLGSLTPEQASRGETYLSVMRSNLESLSTALECR
jgi:zinc transport system substrate-binding protein